VDPKNGKFGNGQRTCKVCGNDLADLRVLCVEIKHKDSGQVLATLEYLAPLCEKHRTDDSISVSMGWADKPVGLSEMENLE